MDKIPDYEDAYKKLSDEQLIIQLKHDHEWAIFYKKIKKIYKELGDDDLAKIMIDHHKYIALNKIDIYNFNGYESISKEIEYQLSIIDNDINHNVDLFYTRK